MTILPGSLVRLVRTVVCFTCFTALVLICSALAVTSAWAQPYPFTTFAGLPFSGASADGTGLLARFAHPTDVAVDSTGTIYVADSANHTIRRITVAGVVTTLAGLAGTAGSADGTGSVARFNLPHGVAVDSAGTIYVADALNHTIRRITTAGVVTTLAGQAGSEGSADGTGNAARFSFPRGVAVSAAGTIYVADSGNRTIRAITSAGVVTTLAGLAGAFGSADGTGSAARLGLPWGVAVSGNGTIYVGDMHNANIRAITPGGVVTTLAGLAGSSGSADGTGSAARFDWPSGVAVDTAGTVYVADTFNQTIRRITPAGVVTTLAGLAGSSGSTDGIGSAARFSYPRGVAVDSTGVVYVADTLAFTIRRSGPPLPAPDMVQNGAFNAGTTGWLQFASPDANAMVSNVTSGVFQFYRQQPQSGTNQAVVFQETGIPLGTHAPIEAQFDLGNSSTARKRMSVVIHDRNFSGLAVCTFWLPPNTPLTTYTMRTHTGASSWQNVTISFYAASTGSDGGFYQLDNVTLSSTVGDPIDRTECVDPLAPAPPGGAASANLIVNGSFGGGTLSPWGLFGTIAQQIVNGVFEFIRPTAAPPAGALLQNTGQALPAGDILTATFQLGNSGMVERRVTVLLHDGDFSDLSACTFWLPPALPLSTYMYRTYTTKAWTNATLSVYPASMGAESWMQWIQLDNVTLQRTPAAAITGTECLELSGDARPDMGALPAPLAAPAPFARVSFDHAGPTGADNVGGASADATVSARGFILRLSDAFDLTTAEAAVLRLRSWLPSASSHATIEVSADEGVTWEIVQLVPPSDTWIPIEVDLAPYLGTRVHVRFVLERATSGGAAQEPWWIDDVSVAIDP